MRRQQTRLQLRAPRRVGARARASDRRDAAGELGRLQDLVEARELVAAESPVAPVGEEGAHEGVARADRVDDLDRRRADLGHVAGRDDERALAAAGDERNRVLLREQRAGGRDGVGVRSDPREVVFAGLDDVRARDEAAEPATVSGGSSIAVGRQFRSTATSVFSSMRSTSASSVDAMGSKTRPSAPRHNVPMRSGKAAVAASMVSPGAEVPAA
jgi:hypothetical protein